MLAEFTRDQEAGGLYESPRLSPAGKAAYPEVLRGAIERGDDETLQRELEAPGMLNAHDTPYVKNGKLVTPKMNRQAPQTMAEGEFNRFYIRALCLVVKEEGGKQVEVFRARQSSWARPESEALIGKLLDVEELLDDLRSHIGEEPSLLPYVNSGLSVRRLPEG
jgi:hypothetical protein